MDNLRTPFQGLVNVISFNRYTYILAIILAAIGFAVGCYSDEWQIYGYIMGIAAIVPVIASVVVSHYVYDRSDLYTLNWLEGVEIASTGLILNFHSGFDETSGLLRDRFPNADLKTFDFFDDKKATEASIRRARKARNRDSAVQRVCPSDLPLDNSCADSIFLIFAAHEIREHSDRVQFFQEISRVAKDSARIVVTEHIRDLPNTLAYSVGVFHLFSRSAWQRTFHEAGLKLIREIKITPFVTGFVLAKYGTPA